MAILVHFFATLAIFKICTDICYDSAWRNGVLCQWAIHLLQVATGGFTKSSADSYA
jgi:hypothetical protein